MPTYLYRCPVHGEFEVEQRISDPKLQSCPQAATERFSDHIYVGGFRIYSCGQPVERLIAGSSFVLKGTGWYRDGYRSGGGGGEPTE